MSISTVPWELHKQPPEFRIGNDHSIFDADGNCIVLLDPTPGYEDELPRIIRCVNSHDELVKTLRTVRRFVQSHEADGTAPIALSLIDSALAVAEATP